MKQEIFIIEETEELYSIVSRLFSDEKNFKIRKIQTSKIEDALKNIPALIIINEDNIKDDVVELAKKIKDNDDNAITPVIVISSDIDRTHRVEVLKAFVEHYIKKPIDEEYLYYTIKNIVRLLDINRKVSPLTGLPGNVQIQAEMKKRLLNKESFVMLYLDLDNFKAYNDIYGFSKGDELIKFTARTILENVQDIDLESGFVGHVGGDDFIAIVSDVDFEKLCQNIIIDFDTGVLKYFTEQHVQDGYIEVENRKGVLEQYPLTTISIGIVPVYSGEYESSLEVGEIGAQVKHLSKTIQGSTYVVNKRK